MVWKMQFFSGALSNRKLWLHYGLLWTMIRHSASKPSLISYFLYSLALATNCELGSVVICCLNLADKKFFLFVISKNTFSFAKKLQLSVLLERLQKVGGLLLKDVHLVGFSLGAHVAGYAGQRLQGIARISGTIALTVKFKIIPRTGTSNHINSTHSYIASHSRFGLLLSLIKWV